MEDEKETMKLIVSKLMGYIRAVDRALTFLPISDFDLFSYPGGLNFKVRQGSKFDVTAGLHETASNGTDRGNRTVEYTARWYYDKLRLYDFSNQSLTPEIIQRKLHEDIGARVDELIERNNHNIKCNILPERLRPYIGGK